MSDEVRGDLDSASCISFKTKCVREEVFVMSTAIQVK